VLLKFGVGSWRKIMRAFMLSCLAAAMIALGAAALLGHFLQEPSSAAFTEPSARIS
jgi:hypothetical protein